MDVENGVWIMRGLSQNDPGCIRSWQALMRWIDYGHILRLFCGAGAVLGTDPGTGTKIFPVRHGENPPGGAGVEAIGGAQP